MRNCSFLILVIVVLWTGSAADAKYSGGSGMPNDPYQIATPADLNDIGNHQEDWNKHFILVNDVNLAGTQFKIIGNDRKYFSGVFDGKDHIIHNALVVGGSTGWGVGLFGYVGAYGQVRNLGVENIRVTGGDCVGGLVGVIDLGSLTSCYLRGNSCYFRGNVYGSGEAVGGLVGWNYRGCLANCCESGCVRGGELVGGLVGWNSWGALTNCYASGNVRGNGNFVGGLVGSNDSGSLANCYSTGQVNGGGFLGGLVGGNSYGDIANCYSTGNVWGNSYVGGLIGRSWHGTVTYSYSSGSVSGHDEVGGLVGRNDDFGTITNCYATGSVWGDEYFGGLVGNNYLSEITNCYSTGSVSGTYYGGGLVGYNYGTIGTITNCYSTGSISGDEYVGGLVGSNYRGIITSSFWDIETSGEPNSAGGTPKTTAEMNMMSTFTDAGWDFVEIWGIGENQTYPYLRFAPAGDLNYDKKVDFIDLAVLASHWLEGM
jgi:hypothetical protein